MTSILVALCAVVGAIGILNLFLMFGVIGRLRLLQSLVEASSMRDPDLPIPGDVVGNFQVTTDDGTQLSETVVQGEAALVGFFTAGCQPCADVRTALLAAPPSLPFFAFVDGTLDDPDTREIAASLKALGPVAMTRSGDAVSRAFKPAGYPTLIRTVRGAVAASGHRVDQVL